MLLDIILICGLRFWKRMYLLKLKKCECLVQKLETNY